MYSLYFFFFIKYQILHVKDLKWNQDNFFSMWTEKLENNKA